MKVMIDRGLLKSIVIKAIVLTSACYVKYARGKLVNKIYLLLLGTAPVKNQRRLIS
jgi:hypothetical protein